MGASNGNSASANSVKSPNKLAHVVLRSNNFPIMVKFYKEFLGAKASYENEFLSFLTYDEEHHRIAIVAIPSIGPKNPETCGLEHIAFAFDTLEDLLVSYRQRKEAHGILPKWSVNHGPTTSIYYQDPDGNLIETQTDNFDNVDDATAFMMSKEFAENPIGTDVDPDELSKRLRGGEDEKVLLKRVEVGPRGIADVQM